MHDSMTVTVAASICLVFSEASELVQIQKALLAITLSHHVLLLASLFFALLL